jgi:hypothetical protein
MFLYFLTHCRIHCSSYQGVSGLHIAMSSEQCYSSPFWLCQQCFTQLLTLTFGTLSLGFQRPQFPGSPCSYQLPLSLLSLPFLPTFWTFCHLFLDGTSLQNIQLLLGCLDSCPKLEYILDGTDLLKHRLSSTSANSSSTFLFGSGQNPWSPP